MWGLSWEGCALLPWLLLNEGWEIIPLFGLAVPCPHCSSPIAVPVLAGAAVAQQGLAALPRGDLPGGNSILCRNYGKIF